MQDKPQHVKCPKKKYSNKKVLYLGWFSLKAFWIFFFFAADNKISKI